MKTKSRKEYYRLPDGELTTNVEIYCSAYRDISEVLEKYYDLEPIGFDPGFLMKKKGALNGTVDIPTWLSKKMVEYAIGK